MHLFHKWVLGMRSYINWYRDDFSADNFSHTHVAAWGYECKVCGKRKVKFGYRGKKNVAVVDDAIRYLNSAPHNTTHQADNVVPFKKEENNG